jgi:hypothetical protein
MDGDYYPGEVDNTIRDMDDGKRGKKAGSDGKKKKAKTKSKNKSSGRKGTRSGGIDEEALAASGVLPPGFDQKSMEAGQQDYVMTKLGQIIEPMKESFIVAYLAWDGAKEEDMVVSKEIMDKREAYIQEESLRQEKRKAKQDAKECEKAEEKDKADGKESAENVSKIESPKSNDDVEKNDVKDEVMEDVSTKGEAENTDSIPKDVAKNIEAIPDAIESNTKIDENAPKNDASPEDDGKTNNETATEKLTSEPNKDTASVAKSEEEANQEGGDDKIDSTSVVDGENKPEDIKSMDIDEETKTDETNIGVDPKEKNDQVDDTTKSDANLEDKPKDETPSEDMKTEDSSSNVENSLSKAGVADTDLGSQESKPPESEAEAESKDEKKTTDEKVKEEQDEEVKKKLARVQRDGKFAAMEARKRNLEGNIKKDPASEKKKEEEEQKKMSLITVKDRHGRLVKVLDDDSEEMDCEFLNNRQLFLELCQTNNYQFDQLRRAKHSSMMVLWHLHNRDAPKFVQQCALCAREILAGYRYHCATCADFDLCQDCYQKQSHNPNRHPHQLKPIPVAVGQKDQQTEEQRKERQRSIQLHMTLLMHAATCNSSKCQSQNCAKMKNLLKHGDTCPIKASGGCNVCKRIWTLLQIHAKQCKEANCPVPKCHAIRERFRQIALQQRAMDDRRRMQMNTHYHQQASG